MTATYHLLTYTACYSIFFIHTLSCSHHRSNRLFDGKGRLVTKKSCLTELYIVGIMWLALVPVAILKPITETVPIRFTVPDTLQIITLLLLIMLLLFTGKKSVPQISNPGNLDPALTKSFLGYYFPLRILFLCVYELFFRGFLLFDCAALFGFPMALTISTALTVMVHVFNNKKEMWACIPFGLMLCSCNYWFQAVWPAVILHITLCMSYEITFVKQFYSKLKPVK